ncbi:hypothetical protein H9Q08_18505 [Chryseobacterium sp. PS-8]|jgi:hypothetical protein|uniref:Uncharacterized protein n=1 Tax=Chryseobacterium indicum TaxID=2766954 RepID=A0ABS9CBC1_9FLAO|nr:hypothetical protein [Chryseobacterium sp. PS-8]MCF2221285.1 hypothetical protein [Chryseobacterium sp. PS-8]
MQNILRNIAASVIGFIVSCIAFLMFFKIEGQGGVLALVFIFLLYVILLIYSLVTENVLLFLYKGNSENAFGVTFSMLFIFSVFYCVYSEDYEQVLNAVSLSIFFILQIGGFFYQKRKIKQ